MMSIEDVIYKFAYDGHLALVANGYRKIPSEHTKHKRGYEKPYIDKHFVGYTKAYLYRYDQGIWLIRIEKRR